MRILLASDHYPPFVGGAQRQTQILASELAARGHEVTVATVWQDDLPARRREGDVAVERLRQLRTLPLVRGAARRRHQPPFADPVTVHELRRLLARVRPEIVHTAGWFSYACAAALRRSDVPLLISARDYGFGCPTATLVHEGLPCSGPSAGKCLSCAGSYYGAPKGWAATLGVLGSRRMLRRRADGLHSISGYVQEMSERDFLAGRTVPLQATIPSFRVEDPPSETHPGLAELPDEPFILFVGALRRVKGVEVLLDAYSRLASPPPLVLARDARGGHSRHASRRCPDHRGDAPLGGAASVGAEPLRRHPVGLARAVWERRARGDESGARRDRDHARRP